MIEPEGAPLFDGARPLPPPESPMSPKKLFASLALFTALGPRCDIPFTARTAVDEVPSGATDLVGEQHSVPKQGNDSVVR